MSLFKTLARDTSTASDTLVILAEVLKDRPEGMFPKELREAIVATGKTVRGVPIEVHTEEGLRALDGLLHQCLQAFTNWHLTTAAEEIPKRLYPNTLFMLFPEPCARITRAGEKLAAGPDWRRRAFIWTRLLWYHTEGHRKKLASAAGVAGGVLTVLKLWLQWQVVEASMGAALAAAVTWTVMVMRGRG